MKSIKNQLTTTLQVAIMPSLINYTATEYRIHDPGLYLYKVLMNFKKEKFSDEFIDLIYTTLIAWNMNQRGAKLSDFSTFKQSLLEHKEIINSLEQYRIEDLEEVSDLINKINFLFENLQLVAKDKPKLVTFSKTIHFFLPNLLMPIDRRYTIKFFYNNESIPKEDNKQLAIYWDVFHQFKKLSTTYDFSKYIDNSWNRSIPKIIDNLLIAYGKKKEVLIGG